MSDTLLLQKEPPLAWIVFNKPERRNAVDLDMWKTLPQLVAEVAADDDLRVLLLRGAGEEAFVSGADISQFGKVRSGAEATRGYDQAVAGALKSLAGLEKPVITMIHGFCMGGGCSVAVMCDLRLCADDARFGIPAARLGIAYPLERGVERLVHIVGVSNAAEILMTARVYNAEEAAHMGLVNRVLPKAELESYTREYALKLADNAPPKRGGSQVFRSGECESRNPARHGCRQDLVHPLFWQPGLPRRGESLHGKTPPSIPGEVAPTVAIPAS